jgi:hypothetical protein
VQAVTQLGKPLVFYLKYWAEMQGLYVPEDEGGQPDLTGLDDAEHVQEMVRTVGAVACEQAADFLQLCGKGIEAHFSGLGMMTIAHTRKRPYIVRNWCWEAKLTVSSVAGGPFWCGVFVSAPPDIRIALEKDVYGVVAPYIWSRGGRKGVDAVWNILGSWAHSRGGEGITDDRGTVILDCVPIRAQPPETFDVDREPLVAEVVKSVARIGAKQAKAMASFVASLREPEES